MIVFHNRVLTVLWLQPAAADVQASELLPAGWNASQDYYVLQYRPSEGNDLYLLKVIRMEDTLLVHVLVRML